MAVRRCGWWVGRRFDVGCGRQVGGRFGVERQMLVPVLGLGVYASGRSRER
ncbi:MAG: hypothetical protein ACR2G7_09745 [Acidimicrobiales bacterium]